MFYTKVIRFGKLFPISSFKSCPFWKSRFKCKDTNYSQIGKRFIP